MPAHGQRAGAKRQGKLFAFVQKMLQKLGHLKETQHLQRRKSKNRAEGKGEKPSWVEAGYVT